ncbi:uncharacterized protein LOC121261054 [Juglans microcarpa x Juglans regia]|uniref:uncharacterized protein LOC121261054 n=1 Tax=Juglans microcarpa x Juglans regia TaxID=2249226 RepID=UPI001B7E3149|nr:uncharacterized protein LOC121261054 [Juglans microcarpa x Juglans regia]
MSIVSSQQSFLTNTLSTPPSNKPNTKILYPVKTISCRYPPHDHQDSRRKGNNQFARLAVVTLAAGVLTLGSVYDALPRLVEELAARLSGHRLPGQSPESTTLLGNIYINPHNSL